MVPHSPGFLSSRPSVRLAATPVSLPPMPEFLSTEFSGVMGFIETAAVLTFSAAAIWVGVRTGENGREKTVVRTVGWVGAAGVALMALLYLGAKTGISQQIGLPTVRVSPS